MSTWSDARRRWWRWGWTALVAGLLLCPLSTTSSCGDAADGGGSCTTMYVPLLGAVTGTGYPGP